MRILFHSCLRGMEFLSINGNNANNFEIYLNINFNNIFFIDYRSRVCKSHKYEP